MYLIDIAPLLGVATAILTEALKLVPWFRKTKTRKRVLAFVISVVLVSVAAWKEGQYFDIEPIDIIGSIGATIATAYALYKAVIK